MVDSGVRVAAALLPAGVPVVVGIVVAVLRRRVMPQVSLPALIGLSLQLVVILISTFVVGFLGLLPGQGWTPEEILTLSSILGFVLIPLQLISWTLLLVALFLRLPATAQDRTPTGRHALLDAAGAQVVAEEGTTLLPVAAGAGAAAVGVGAGAAVAGSSTDTPPWETPPLQPAGPPPGRPGAEPRPWGPDEEPAVTETIAASPAAGPAPADADHSTIDETAIDDGTIEDADEDAWDEDAPDGPTGVVAATPDEDDEDDAPDFEAEDDPEHEHDDVADAEDSTDEAEDDIETDGPPSATGTTAPDHGSVVPSPEESADERAADGEPHAEEDGDAHADAEAHPSTPGPTATTTGATTVTGAATPRTSSSAGHPWFTPTGTGAVTTPASDGEEPSTPS